VGPGIAPGCQTVFATLSPVHTVTQNGEKTATVAEFATVALFCDSRRFRRQIVAEIGDSVDMLLCLWPHKKAIHGPIILYILIIGPLIPP